MTRVHQSLLALGASTLLALGATGCGSITADGGSSGGSGGSSGGANAGQAAEAHADPADLAGRTFVTTALDESGALPAYLADARARLSFEQDARKITAKIGCNGMFGDLRAGDGTLTIDALGGTKMACEKQLMRQDDWLRGLLESDPSWKLSDGELTITGEGTKLVLKEQEEMKPQASLRDTTWSLQSVARASASGSDKDDPVRSGDAIRKVELRFVDPKGPGETGKDESSKPAKPGKDGKPADLRVEGNGGCNAFGGEVWFQESDRKAYDGAIHFGAVTSTLKACSDDVMRVEKRLLRTLDGTVPYTLENGELTLYGEAYELTFSSSSKGSSN